MARSARLIAGAAVAGAGIAFTFALVLLAALHAPAPHHLPVGVAAPADVAAQVSAGSEQRAPGALDVRPYADPAAAEQDVRDGDLAGAFVVGPEGPQLLVAGARGGPTSDVLEAAFTPVVAASGQQLAVHDLVPLPSYDRAGVSPFFAVVALLVPSFAVAALLGRQARRIPVLALAGALILSAALIGGAVAWVADGLLGALPGHPWQLAGLVALASFGVSGSALALIRMLGLGGIPLAGLVLLLFGIPATGGPAGADFLPRFFHWLSVWHPAGAAGRSIRELLYFSSHGLGSALAVLIGWAAAALVVLLATAPLTVRSAPSGVPRTRPADLAPSGAG